MISCQVFGGHTLNLVLFVLCALNFEFGALYFELVLFSPLAVESENINPPARLRSQSTKNQVQSTKFKVHPQKQQ